MCGRPEGGGGAVLQPVGLTLLADDVRLVKGALQLLSKRHK